MKHVGIFLLVLSTTLSSFGQARVPRTLGGSDEEQADTKEAVAYREGMAGITKLVFSAVQPPETLKECANQDQLKKLVEKRFASETNGPALVEKPETPVPIFELWLEVPEDNPELFQTTEIPSELFAFALQMRVTAFPESASGKVDSSRRYTALEGNTVWWGTKEKCNKGMEKAVASLLDRFYAEYRTANPGARLPTQ